MSKNTTCKQLVKMNSYCLKCRKNTENINPRVSNTSNGRRTILSKYAIRSSKKSSFIKDQDAKGPLINLSVRAPLSKVPIWVIFCFKVDVKLYIKKNKIVSKFLLLGDRFMPQMQPGFTYSPCGPFTKNKERIQKFKRTRDVSYI